MIDVTSREFRHAASTQEIDIMFDVVRRKLTNDYVESIWKIWQEKRSLSFGQIRALKRFYMNLVGT